MFIARPMFVITAVKLASRFEAVWKKKRALIIEPSQLLTARLSSAKLKACRDNGTETCLLDDDGDGDFDRFAPHENAGAETLPSSIPYTKTMPVIVPSTDSTRLTSNFLYLGRSGQQIRIGYREFANDLARPAFNEDLNIDIPQQLPGKAAFKGYQMTILAIGPEGMRFHLDKLGDNRINQIAP